MPQKLKILIADDHAIVRDGLVALLGLQRDFEVVGAAVDGREAVAKAAETKPDLVLMDLMMPELDGAAATAEIRKACPSARVLILTSYGEAASLSQAFAFGATGAITKNLPKEQLFDAIRRVASGVRVVSPEIEQTLEEEEPGPDLSERQLAILDGLTRGLTNKEIARQLDLSASGIKFHLYAIFRKLGAANRSEAVSIALRKQLLKV